MANGLPGLGQHGPDLHGGCCRPAGSHSYRTAGALIVCLAAAMALAAGCLWRGAGQESDQGLESLINLEFVGRAEAERIRFYPDLIPGPGAEGRVGDYLLQNAFVRFVVGAEDHDDPSPACAGGLLDAAVHGGEDRMRLLVPQVGAGDTPNVVCEEVSLAEQPTDSGSAVVVASGHLRGNSSVLVRTEYRLQPGSRSLEIATSVENRGESVAGGLEFGDLVYQGRTERFVEGWGLHPAGRELRTEWFSFFGGGFVWGLSAADRGPVDSTHWGSHSCVVYERRDVGPGKVRKYYRSLTAAYGYPARIGSELRGTDAAMTAELTLHVTEKGTRHPVEGAYVSFSSPARADVALVVTDSGGNATLRLPEGSYKVTCGAPGRNVFEAIISIARGAPHAMSISLLPRAGLRLRVNASTHGFVRPTGARVTVRPTSDRSPSVHNGPLFSGLGGSRTVLVPASGEAFVPLLQAKAGPLAEYEIVASKGPLYDTTTTRVSAAPGTTVEAEVTLQQVIDPGDYAAVDCGQRVDWSPDSVLTLAERVLLNCCEGLDGALVVRQAQRVEGPLEPADADPPVIAALEVMNAYTGRITVLPEPAARLPSPDEWGESADEVFSLLRDQSPGSLIQLEAPTGSTGYFALAGFRPEAPDSPPLSEHFDAIRLLTGRQSRDARLMLPYWFSLLNSGRRVIVTGGSDSGSVTDTASLGARTYLHCPRLTGRPTSDELIRAVRALPATPDAFVSNGPFLKVTLNGRPIGSLVAATEGSVRLRLKVEAPQWVDVARVKVFRNGECVQTLEAGEREDAVVLERELELEAESDCWFVVSVEGDKGMTPVYSDEQGRGAVPFAVTNPFWVDADGDGVVTPAP